MFFDRTFLIGVLLSLVSKFINSHFLSEQSIVYWSSDGVVSFGLPDCVLDTSDWVQAVF